MVTTPLKDVELQPKLVVNADGVTCFDCTVQGTFNFRSAVQESSHTTNSSELSHHQFENESTCSLAGEVEKTFLEMGQNSKKNIGLTCKIP